MPHSMDELRQAVPVDSRRESSSALPFAEQREQIRRFLGELTETTVSAEAEIAGVVKRLLDDTAAHRGGALSREVAAREAQLVERERQLTDELKRVEERRAEVEALLQAADARGSGAVEAEQRAQLALQEITARQRQLTVEQEEVARLKQRLDDKLRRHEGLEEELESEQSRTKAQRRRIAGELNEQREVLRRDQQRAEQELLARGEELLRRERQLQSRAEELERQAAEASATLAARADDSALRDELVRAQLALAERSSALMEAEAALAEAHAELQAVRQAAADAQREAGDSGEWERRATDAEADAAELRDLLDHARRKLSEADELSEAAADADDLRRALSIAQEDFATCANATPCLRRRRPRTMPRPRRATLYRWIGNRKSVGCWRCSNPTSTNRNRLKSPTG
ncbi:MAG: hypothetical protein QM775_02465 [Pirellulales bacterium]